MRLKTTELSSVNYVILSKEKNSKKIIDFIKPKIYVKEVTIKNLYYSN